MLNPRYSDKELIVGIKNGDKSLFSACFMAYYPSLSDYAAALLKDHAIAEEVVQETFIKIWESREQITIEVSLKAYLFRCVHNNCINYTKHIAVHAKHTDKFIKEVNYHLELVTRNFSESILDIIISEETGLLIDNAIEQLPDQCKQVFCLSRYDQLTYQEIAEKLNVSINTVKTQMSRAIEKLKGALRKNEEK